MVPCKSAVIYAVVSRSRLIDWSELARLGNECHTRESSRAECPADSFTCKGFDVANGISNSENFRAVRIDGTGFVRELWSGTNGHLF